MAERLAPAGHRPAWAEVDLDAIRGNAGALRDAVAPTALCAVVKANGYGHGAVEVARAALEGGATWLAVALVEEGVALRDAGIEAPILLLSQAPESGVAEAVDRRLTVTVYTAEGVQAVAAAAAAAGRQVPVHLKVDTGMHRVGAAPADALALAKAAAASEVLHLEGLWTHFAVADEAEQDGFTGRQLEQLLAVRDELAAAGLRPELLHAANSAGALSHPAARLDLVRCGIALYGYPPRPAAGGQPELRPALSLRARVAHVRRLPAGERISYGRRYALPDDAAVATVPLGYADGVPRALSAAGAEVLVGGRRCRIAGTVTMDQVMVDCGAVPVSVGDEVVFLGSQGGETVTAEEWAALLGTISYEVVSSIGARVPRVVRGAGTS